MAPKRKLTSKSTTPLQSPPPQQPLPLQSIVLQKFDDEDFYRVEGTIFKPMGNGDAYLTQLDDYAIISNFALDELNAFVQPPHKRDVLIIPREIRIVLKKMWQYHIHVSPLRLNREFFDMQVKNDGILGYCYTDKYRIENTDAIYFGFLPSGKKRYIDTFSIDDPMVMTTESKIGIQHLYPRRFYISLKKKCSCICSDNCFIVEYETRDHKFVNCCVRQIDWTNVLILMGEYDDAFVDLIKDVRQCQVCATCRDCNKLFSYCRKHKVCKHKARKFIDDNEEQELQLARFKRCKKNEK